MTKNNLKHTRKKLGIQMLSNQLFKIINVIKKPINFLIFGLGNDSLFWFNINKKGRTVFIEDNKQWFFNIKGKYPFLEVYLVEYKTKRSEWKDLINSPEKLYLDLPKSVLKMDWDVVLVDAPQANKDKYPGRMKSIYMASNLVKDQGDVFVHDCQRIIERKYCDKYLGKKRLVSKTCGITHGEFTILRHYK